MLIRQSKIAHFSRGLASSFGENVQFCLICLHSIQVDTLLVNTSSLWLAFKKCHGFIQYNRRTRSLGIRQCRSTAHIQCLAVVLFSTYISVSIGDQLAPTASEKIVLQMHDRCRTQLFPNFFTTYLSIVATCWLSDAATGIRDVLIALPSVLFTELHVPLSRYCHCDDHTPDTISEINLSTVHIFHASFVN